MLESAAFTLGMVLLGLAVGIIAAGLGLGGGILMVPAFLTFVPGMDPHTAKGTSLFIIIFVALFNAWQLNQGHPDKALKIAAVIALGSIVGVYAGTWITAHLTDAVVRAIFAAFVVITGVRTLFIQPRSVAAGQVRTRYTLSVLIGLAMGVVSGATGIGGGGVMVPLALMAGIVTNARVVALSNTVMVVTCIAGAIAHAHAPQTFHEPWTVGQVYLGIAPMVIIGAFAGAPLGRIVNRHLTLRRRKWVMGVLLIVIAARMLIV
jgi:uncharacterized protein